MADNDEERLFGSYRVRTYDKNGELVQSDTVESTGSIVIEDVFTTAFLEGIERIEIDPLTIEVREGDEVKHRIETELSSDYPS